MLSGWCHDEAKLYIILRKVLKYSVLTYLFIGTYSSIWGYIKIFSLNNDKPQNPLELSDNEDPYLKLWMRFCENIPTVP